MFYVFEFEGICTFVGTLYVEEVYISKDPVCTGGIY